MVYGLQVQCVGQLLVMVETHADSLAEAIAKVDGLIERRWFGSGGVG